MINNIFKKFIKKIATKEIKHGTTYGEQLELVVYNVIKSLGHKVFMTKTFYDKNGIDLLAIVNNKLLTIQVKQNFDAWKNHINKYQIENYKKYVQVVVLEEGIKNKLEKEMIENAEKTLHLKVIGRKDLESFLKLYKGVHEDKLENIERDLL